jgi:hypothetical protein
MFFSSRLGTGFISPYKKKNLYYFDKDKFLTLGTGDEVEKVSETNDILEEREEFSKFLAVLQTLIFFTDPSESNYVMIPKWRFLPLLEELFEEYVFGEEEKEGAIIFCEDVTNKDYNHLEPYLVMGGFMICENILFNDGTLLRPIYGNKIRLMIKGKGKREWNFKEIKKMLDYHHYKVRRDYCFREPETGLGSISFDCAAVNFLYLKYLMKINLPDGDFSLLKEMIEKWF